MFEPMSRLKNHAVSFRTNAKLYISADIVKLMKLKEYKRVELRYDPMQNHLAIIPTHESNQDTASIYHRIYGAELNIFAFAKAAQIDTSYSRRHPIEFNNEFGMWVVDLNKEVN